MNTIHLIVTGDMEKAGLVDALTNIPAFKSLRFTIQQMKGITDNKIPKTFSSKAKKNRDVDKLASAMLSSVVKERSGKQQLADMVIVIDDLELANLSQPKVVLDFFAEALHNQIMERFSSQKVQDKYFQKVKEACSFHFLVPMGEAYFFFDVPNALKRAGANIQSKVDGSKRDVEKFLVPNHVYNGVDYLNAPTGQKKKDPYWTINPPFRPQHPKKYLDFLCCPETKYTSDNKDQFYKEYRKKGLSGTNALKTLNWQKVLSNKDHAQYLRALIHDIVDKFEIYPLPFPGKCASLTKYTGQGKILRNF